MTKKDKDKDKDKDAVVVLDIDAKTARKKAIKKGIKCPKCGFEI